jgi:hypothetical protein
MASWTCNLCNTVNDGGEMCRNCGAQRPAMMALSGIDFERSDTAAESIFLANPRNKPYVSGRSKWLGTAPGEISVGCFTLLMLPFIAVGIFLIISAVSEWREYTQLTRDGVVIQGTVTDREIDDDDDGTSYYVTYRYIVNERSYTNRVSVAWDEYNAMEPERRVSIIYSRSEPSISQMGTTPSNSSLLVAMGFGFCWNVYEIFFIIVWLRTSKNPLVGKTRRLAREGRLLHGQVEQCQGYQDKDSDGDTIYKIRLRYKLRIPDGEEVTGEERVQRSDLRNKPLPVEGTPIAVLYVSSAEHHVM